LELAERWVYKVRKNQIKGIINDLLDLNGYRNPLGKISLKNKLEANLLTKELLSVDEDDVYKFYLEKISWFHNRIKELKGNLKDFEEAKIIASLNKETIKITYKGEKFSDRVVWK